MHEGSTNVPSRPFFWRHAEPILLLVTATTAIAYSIHFALREFTPIGTILIGGLLLSLVLASVTARFRVTWIAYFVMLLGFIDLANHFKQHFVKQALSFYDLFVLKSQGATNSLNLILDHASVHVPLRLSLLAFLAALILIPLINKQFLPKVYERPPLITTKPLSAFMVIAFAVAIFCSSYIRAVAEKGFIYDRPPLRLSTIFGGIVDYANLQLRMTARSIERPIVADPDDKFDCAKCPDIIFMHSESNFDPTISKPFETAPPIGEALDRTTAGAYGPLKVNIWGGLSWITEFELFCGTHYKLFGNSGIAAPITLAPFVKSCLPQHLKALGYETFAVYTTPRSWLNVGPAFQSYGIDTVYDISDLGLEGVVTARKDEIFIKKALEILDSPRRKPRFIFVSTIFNHSPYYKSDRGPDSIVYPGPYDASSAGTSEYIVYINRLNYCIEQIALLEAAARSRPFPIATLVYGDHQPPISLDYTNAASAEHEGDIRYTTFYRATSNSTAIGDGIRPGPVRIEQLGRWFMDFIGLRPSKTMRSLEQVACYGNQRRCSPTDASRILGIITNGDL